MVGSQARSLPTKRRLAMKHFETGFAGSQSAWIYRSRLYQRAHYKSATVGETVWTRVHLKTPRVPKYFARRTIRLILLRPDRRRLALHFAVHPEAISPELEDTPATRPE